MLSVLVLIPVFLFSCSPREAGSLNERMQSILDRGIARYGIHGVSATVIFPDGTIWNGVSGVSHDAVKIAPDMVFAVGSITKNVVAALTLKLVEDGILSLEAPLSRWLPDYPHVDGRITIRQLLNHTSGIDMYWNSQDIWDALIADPARTWAPEEVLGYIKEPHFRPGEGWAYSNTNYLLLAMILEKATATPLPELLRKRLFEPYRMAPITLSQEDNTPPNQAHIYGDDLMFGDGDKDNTFAPRAAHESIGFGSNGIFTTSETLARWGHRLFGGEILQPGSLQAMMEMVTFAPVANMRAYGLGVQEYDRQFSAGRRAIGHGGGNIGTSSHLVHFPDLNITIVVMINAFPNRGLGVITRKLIRVVLRDLDVIGPFPYIDPARLKLPASLFAVSFSIFLAAHWWKWRRKRREKPGPQVGESITRKSSKTTSGAGRERVKRGD